MRPSPSVRQLRDIRTALDRSKNGVPLALKLRTAEILLGIQDRRVEPFGLLVILGWKNAWDDFAVVPDESQDIFRGRNITHRYTDEDVEDRRATYRGIAGTVMFDGAILIDGRGTVLSSGVMIEGLRPREIATKLHPGKFSDLSAQFGFSEKVHTRHLTAIAASYQFKGSTIFTISEESGRLHIFESGTIVYAGPPRSVGARLAERAT